MNGRTDGRTDERTDEQKSPCVLQDFVPFGAAAQKGEKRKKREKKRKKKKKKGGRKIFKLNKHEKNVSGTGIKPSIRTSNFMSRATTAGRPYFLLKVNKGLDKMIILD